MNESFTPTENDEEILDEALPSSEKKGMILFILGTVFSVLIIAGVVVLGVFYFKTPEKNVSAEIQPTIVPQATEKPENVILKNEEITFEILNATGVAGTATKYKDILEKKGYKVNLVGMAAENQKGITIYFVKGLEVQKETLLADLKKEFPKISDSGEMTDSTNMVRIVVGR